MKTSIVIPCKNEHRLADTIRGIDTTCGAQKPEIIVVHDGEAVVTDHAYLGVVKSFTTGLLPIGTSASRHYGVLQSSGDFIITIDGHMAFDDNNWLQAMVDEAVAYPKAVLCSGSTWLSEKTPTFKDAQRHGTGATVHWKDSCGVQEYRALEAKWSKNDAGEIGVVMGACYGFMKDWYLHGMQAPWDGAAGWGMDEVMLSIPSWLCGGSTRLVDTAVGHWFNDTQRSSTLVYTDTMLTDVWANRLRVLEVLPLTGADRLELITHVKSSGGYQARQSAVSQRLAAGMQVERVRAHLGAQKRKMTDYMSEWGIR